MENITKEHVLTAVERIDKENIILNASTGYDVIINGKPYPPKEIMRYANEIANGKKEWLYLGGDQTKLLKDITIVIFHSRTCKWHI